MKNNLENITALLNAIPSVNEAKMFKNLVAGHVHKLQNLFPSNHENKVSQLGASINECPYCHLIFEEINNIKASVVNFKNTIASHALIDKPLLNLYTSVTSLEKEFLFERHKILSIDPSPDRCAKCGRVWNKS